jgi:hypothetical protein
MVQAVLLGRPALVHSTCRLVVCCQTSGANKTTKVVAGRAVHLWTKDKKNLAGHAPGSDEHRQRVHPATHH